MAGAEQKSAPVDAGVAHSALRKKLVLLSLLCGLLVLMLIAGAVYVLWLAPAEPADDAPSEEAPTAISDTRPVRFLALEPITVNLPSAPEGPDLYLQAVLNLEFTDPLIEASLKMWMPVLRHRFMLHLTTQEVERLRSAEGKQVLVEHLRAEANAILASDRFSREQGLQGQVLSVLFASFLIQ